MKIKRFPKPQPRKFLLSVCPKNSIRRSDILPDLGQKIFITTTPGNPILTTKKPKAFFLEPIQGQFIF